MGVRRVGRGGLGRAEGSGGERRLRQWRRGIRRGLGVVAVESSGLKGGWRGDAAFSARVGAVHDA